MASALRVERSRQFALEVSNSSKEKGCEMKEDLFFLRWSKELQAEVIKRERERERECVCSFRSILKVQRGAFPTSLESPA